MSRRRTRDKRRDTGGGESDFLEAARLANFPHQRSGSSGNNLVSAGAVEREDTSWPEARLWEGEVRLEAEG
jgi:hypothetical protein